MFHKKVADQYCHATIFINPDKIVRILGFLILFSFIADILAHIIRLSTSNILLLKTAYLFLLDEEQNFPTYLSSMLFLLNSALSLNISTLLAKKDKEIIYWRGLAFLFLFFSLDEFIMIHEKMGGILNLIIHTSGVLTFNWIILYGFMALIVAVLYLRFFLRLPIFMRKRFMLVAALFFLGSFVGEMIEGFIYHKAGGGKPPHFYVVASLEEVLEMCGALILIQTLFAFSYMKKIDLKSETPIPE
jgi:hypothetical protein